PDEQGNYLHCAAAPSLPGFSAHVGRMEVSPKGASCGTAVSRREPVDGTDMLTDPRWDDYRHLMSPYGIRSVWSRPLFTSEGTVLGTFAILYRESRSNSLAAVDIARSSFRTGAVPASRRIKCPYERSRRGRTRSYPSSAASQQLGHRGTEWRCRALGNEANIVGLQDEEASYQSTCHGPQNAQRRRRGWRRLSLEAV